MVNSFLEITLDDYDNEQLDKKGKSSNNAIFISYEEFMELIKAMRQEFNSRIFAKEKDNSFKSSITQIIFSSLLFVKNESYKAFLIKLQQDKSSIVYKIFSNLLKKISEIDFNTTQFDKSRQSYVHFALNLVWRYELKDVSSNLKN